MDLIKVGKALNYLWSTYAKVAAYKEYASTSPHRAEEGHYTRRALKWKAKAIVGHDRILTDKTPYF